MFGSEARPAVPALTKSLLDEHELIRFMAAEVLLRIEPRNQQALKIANAARAAIPALRPAGQRQHQLDVALEDPLLQAQFDQIIRLYIIATASHTLIGGLDERINSLPPEAVPALVRGLNLVAMYQIGFC